MNTPAEPTPARYSRRRALTGLAVASAAGAAATLVGPAARADAVTTTNVRWFDVTVALNGQPGALRGVPNAATAAAIQYRINQANLDTQNGDDAGAVVYLPAGHYWLEAGLYLRKNVWLCGDGPGTVIRTQPGFTQPAIISCLGASPDEAAAVTISDLRLYTQPNQHNRAGLSGINVEVVSGNPLPPGSTPPFAPSFTLPDGNVKIHNVTIAGLPGAGIYIAANCRGTSISDVTIIGPDTPTATSVGVHSIGYDGSIVNVTCRDLNIGFRLDSPQRRIHDCRAAANTTGYWINTAGTQLTTCHATANTTGYKITGELDDRRLGATGRNMLIGCTANDNTNYGIDIDAVSRDVLDAVAWAWANCLWGVQAAGNGTDIRAGDSADPIPSLPLGVHHSLITGTAGTVANLWPTRQVTVYQHPNNSTSFGLVSRVKT